MAGILLLIVGLYGVCKVLAGKDNKREPFGTICNVFEWKKKVKNKTD
jgi:hypothetical protein